MAKRTAQQFLVKGTEPGPDFDQLHADKVEPSASQRYAEGYLYTDQRNARMRCPVNSASHTTVIWRARGGVNIGKLCWKCSDCKDSKPNSTGKFLGFDSELESDGMKTIDTKRSKPEDVEEGAIVASGRGVDWSRVAAQVESIDGTVKELGGQINHLFEFWLRDKAERGKQDSSLREYIFRAVGEPRSFDLRDARRIAEYANNANDDGVIRIKRSKTSDDEVQADRAGGEGVLVPGTPDVADAGGA